MTDSALQELEGLAKEHALALLEPVDVCTEQAARRKLLSWQPPDRQNALLKAQILLSHVLFGALVFDELHLDQLKKEAHRLGLKPVDCVDDPALKSGRKV